MKDFCSGREIDIQGLMNVLKSSEFKEVIMDQWLCGTAGCLIGNFMISNPQDALQPLIGCPSFLGHENSIWSISRRFGLSLEEVEFLFTSGHLEFQSSLDAADLYKEAALNRLRKFIYYKMRKSELLEDYELARKSSDTEIVKNTSENVKNSSENVLI